jgi:tRNA pseudouridine synthase 10
MAKRTFSPIIFHFPFEFNGFEDEKLIHNLIGLFKQIGEEYSFNTFSLGVSWPDLEEEQISELKKTVQYSLAKKIEEELGKKADFSSPEAYFALDFNKKSILVNLTPVFLYGKYCKFSRALAQTTHFCRKCGGKGCSKCRNSGLKTSESVEQLLAQKLVPAFKAIQLVFHGAGREDVDVLMLGEGRPFVVELVQPKKRVIDLEKVTKKINSELKDLISINSLKYSNKKEVVEVKNSVHDKIYSAIVSCETKPELNKLKLNEKIKVIQKTPVRVSKRRVLKDREKEVTLLETKIVSDSEKENKFELKLQTSHGTYVKEFISGDEERTNPNISSVLGTKCSCEQLDVLEIV